MTDTLSAAPARPDRVLLIEDDDAVRRSLHLLLHGRGFDVKSYASAATLANDRAAADARFLIADYRLADGDGIGVLRGLKRRGWHGRAILVTGHYSDALCDAALASGFDAVLAKPLKHGQLMATLTPGPSQA
ncbi:MULTISPECIES: response regulator transcription factor [unclassified Sphingomonas]|jgi:FixJ family two-component response regulator|uniref:response regulator transcription factor n=1 Tax=unclassified Sphingomonas TaxID=196159 RepID=UPI0008348FE7|nr:MULTISPECIES: response regulator [unclassified Sphingomonas]MCH4894643.1 response regulator [Sphingomonas sp. SFZ2018-12]